jgi:hypothetical protein
MKSIQSVGILSCAKIMGAIYGALGLIFVPILLLTTLVSAFAGDHVNRMVAIAGDWQ